jgi:hypothetical protein
MSTVADNLWPLDFTVDTDGQLRHAAHQYQLELGWTTSVHDNVIQLHLDDDIWGLRVAPDVAVDVVAALERMRLCCPVVDLPGPARQCVMLLEPVGRTAAAPPFLPSVRRLPSGHRVPLPPSVTADGPVRWLTCGEPDGIRRPSVHAVIDLLTRCTGNPGTC